MEGIDLTNDQILVDEVYNPLLVKQPRRRGAGISFEAIHNGIMWSMSKGESDYPWYVQKEEHSLFYYDEFAWRYNPTGCDRCGAKLQPWDFWSLCTDCNRMEENITFNLSSL